MAVEAQVVVPGLVRAQQQVQAFPKSFRQLFGLHSTSVRLKDLEFQPIQQVMLQ